MKVFRVTFDKRLRFAERVSSMSWRHKDYRWRQSQWSPGDSGVFMAIRYGSGWIPTCVGSQNIHSFSLECYGLKWQATCVKLKAFFTLCWGIFVGHPNHCPQRFFHPTIIKPNQHTPGNIPELILTSKVQLHPSLHILICEGLVPILQQASTVLGAVRAWDRLGDLFISESYPPQYLHVWWVGVDHVSTMWQAISAVKVFLTVCSNILIGYPSAFLCIFYVLMLLQSYQHPPK